MHTTILVSFISGGYVDEVSKIEQIINDMNMMFIFFSVIY